MSKLYLFDFDHTLTRKDSFLSFLRFHVSFGQRFAKWTQLFPIVVKYSWKRDSHGLKQAVLKKFFSGKSENELNQMGESFLEGHMKNSDYFKKDILSVLDQAVEDDSTVYVVSASLSWWLKPWCNWKGVKLICTEAEYEEGIFKGVLAGKNCNGSEKKRRIEREIDLKNFDEIIAFGNRGPDDAMLSLATKKHIV